MKKPTRINICGIPHSVVYVDKPSEVDSQGYESKWGEYNGWTRTIRVYDKGSSFEDVLQIILHEVFHAVSILLSLESFKCDGAHNDLDCLALAITDMMIRNGWITPE